MADSEATVDAEEEEEVIVEIVMETEEGEDTIEDTVEDMAAEDPDAVLLLGTTVALAPAPTREIVMRADIDGPSITCLIMKTAPSTISPIPTHLPFSENVAFNLHFFIIVASESKPRIIHCSQSLLPQSHI